MPTFSKIDYPSRLLCSKFPPREEFKRRIITTNDEVLDESIAPDNAYLRLTKEEITSLLFRVKQWEASWSFSEKSISTTVTEIFEDGTLPYNYEFSYPAKTTSILKYLFNPPFVIDESFDERVLICSDFYFFEYVSTFDNDTALAISSTEEIIFPDAPNEFTDGSRSSMDKNEINSFRRFIEANEIYDIGFKDGFYYWPFPIDIEIDMGSSKDGLLFAEEFEGTNVGDITGTLPAIRGRLSTDPRWSDVSGGITSHKVYFHLPTPNNKILEFGLYDLTEPTPYSNTRFNVDGFSGVTIKPYKYWPHDPEDGGGPIYDEDTGDQLRSLP